MSVMSSRRFRNGSIFDASFFYCVNSSGIQTSLLPLVLPNAFAISWQLACMVLLYRLYNLSGLLVDWSTRERCIFDIKISGTKSRKPLLSRSVVHLQHSHRNPQKIFATFLPFFIVKKPHPTTHFFSNLTHL